MKNNGFTLIETVFSLTIVSFCTMFFVTFLNIMTKQNYELPYSQDETSIHQSRIIFALSNDIRIDFDMLYFTYLGKEMNYEFIDSKLLLEDGYQVFLRNIKDAYFYKENGCYFLSYQRDQKINKRIIGCE